MIEVAERKLVPYYEVECPECKSLLRYTRADVSLCHITCPVCGVSVWVTPIEGGQSGFYEGVDNKKLLSMVEKNNRKWKLNSNCL